MKQSLLYLIIGLFVFCSCNEEEQTSIDSKKLTFHVTPQNEVQSKAGGDSHRYILAVYDTEGNPLNLFAGSNQLEQKSGVFNIELEAKEECLCVFWADYGKTNSSDNFYDTSDLKRVKIRKGHTPTEAFAGQIITSPSQKEYDITLTHAVARMDFIATDHVGENNTLLVSYSSNYGSLNVLDGSLTAGEGMDERSYPLKATTGKLISDYIFAPKESALMDITVQMANAKPKEIKNVPHQVNYKTNIRGNYMSGVAYFNVTAEDNWWELYPGEVQKETYFPKYAWNVASNNDYMDPNSQFNVYRMMETPNLVAFWEAGFGEDPETCPDEKFRFPLRELMEEAEKMFRFFRDELKFADHGNSITDKYRMVLYFYYSEEGTIYGGSADNLVGAMWITPNRVKNGPFRGIAHEMGHSFQFTTQLDHKNSVQGSSVFEMTSQYMLWQYYPTWIVFENYHLSGFMDKTHYALMHDDNMYHSPFVFEYWASLHGKEIIGTLWGEMQAADDIIMAYKRHTGLGQTGFNDELLQGYLQFMTWDMDRIRDVSAPYINQHTTTLKAVEEGWYQVSDAHTPQNYGYNGIALEVPEHGTTVSINFKGLVDTENAGWRYGFVALKENGERVYSDSFSNEEAAFLVPEGTANLWLVVMGAPETHTKINMNQLDKWPYQFKLTGTNPISN